MPKSSTRAFLRTIKDIFRGLGEVRHLARMREQTEYLGHELTRIAMELRRTAWQQQRGSALAAQTKSSFDFQWEHLAVGQALPSDAAFMRGLETHICTITALPREWFRGKRIVDVGCGLGRYSYGFLRMGATVTACDQSEAGLRRTAELCAPFKGRLTLKRIDLLEWNEIADFDLAFSFGVTHHTGNTYLAIENVCRKVRPGGRLFLMIYGVPATRAELREVNEYDRIAAEVRDLSFDDRKVALVQRFGAERAHSWFDAVSPRINDRLTFDEIHDLLTELGFIQIVRTVAARNHHIIAERPPC